MSAYKRSVSLLTVALLCLTATAFGCAGDGFESTLKQPKDRQRVAPPATSTSDLPPPAQTTTTRAISSKQRSPLFAEQGKVKQVVDGDTIRVMIKGRIYTVRYIGVDTPETHHPRVGLECFGQRAAQANNKMAGGKTVGLEKDVSNTDRYGRLLRYVWVDGNMINRQLVAKGYAVSSAYPPDIRRQEEFRAAERSARAKKLGLWSACGGVDTPAGRRPGAGSDSALSRKPGAISPGRYKLPACSKTDCDCDDFGGDEGWATWFLRSYDKDNSHRLDGDRDGKACESR